MMEKQYEIPIVLLLFKREDTLLKIIERIRIVKPQKMYLLSDEGRDKEECQLVRKVRKTVLSAIDWPCEIVENFALENRGVHGNIGMGARWVFEREKMAVFLEDDNLPEVTFFRYCEELLNRYMYDNKVLWICGTNYLEEHYNELNESYFFTQHLLPCGWASWSNKFLTNYDAYFKNVNEYTAENFKKSYNNKALYRQQLTSINNEIRCYKKKQKFGSWDYQMLFAIRSNDMYGIAPCRNQIKNIGVDNFSEHGGTSWKNIMTRRFCGITSYPMNFPLVHPQEVKVDYVFEKSIGKIILFPISLRIKGYLNSLFKRIFKIDPDESLHRELRKRINKKR